MARRAVEDPVREDRMLFEIVVDAYNETERAMSWYYYLQDQLEMPFSATCRGTRSTSPLNVGQKVEVLAMASEDDCMSEVHVLVKIGRSKLAVPLDQLQCTSTNDPTCQGVADWHYWRARGYEY
jgi:hypothetical protein